LDSQQNCDRTVHIVHFHPTVSEEYHNLEMMAQNVFFFEKFDRRPGLLLVGNSSRLAAKSARALSGTTSREGETRQSPSLACHIMSMFDAKLFCLGQRDDVRSDIINIIDMFLNHVFDSVEGRSRLIPLILPLQRRAFDCRFLAFDCRACRACRDVATTC